MLVLARDRTSELYHGEAQHRGAGHRCAFWDGFDGLTRSANAVAGTLSGAAFQAGKEWARISKREGLIAPKSAPPASGIARSTK